MSDLKISNNTKFLTFWTFGLAMIVLSLVFFRALLLSLSVAIFLTYIIEPVVKFINAKWVRSRRVSSVVATVLVFGLLSVVIGALMPYIYSQALGLIKLIPPAVGDLYGRIEPLKQWVIDQGFLGTHALDSFMANLSVVDELSDQLGGTFQKIWQSTPRVVGGVLNLLLVPVITFFLLFEMDRIKAWLSSLVPQTIDADLKKYLHEIDQTLKAVLKGQVMVAAVLAVLYMVGLEVVGLDFGIGIGAIAGVFRLVPYMDVVAGTFLSLVVIASQGLGFGTAIAVGLVFIVVQLVDGMIITPRIIGERAGLHPAVVILSAIAFSDWFGLIGVFIVIPTLAVVKITSEVFLRHYRESNFYRQ